MMEILANSSVGTEYLGSTLLAAADAESGILIHMAVYLIQNGNYSRRDVMEVIQDYTAR